MDGEQDQNFEDSPDGNENFGQGDDQLDINNLEGAEQPDEDGLPQDGEEFVQNEMPGDNNLDGHQNMTEEEYQQM